MRPVGIHMRLNGSLKDALMDAENLHLTAFQLFLFHQQSNRSTVRPLHDERVRFARFVETLNENVFAHASYLINPAAERPFDGHYLFKREIATARMLSINRMVIHPGAYPKGVSHIKGLDTVVEFFNNAMRTYPTMLFIVENSAFGEPSVGGNLQDLRYILDRIDFPEKLSFCIDTAHAHTYGYSLTCPATLEEFVARIDAALPADRIALLHINDTEQKVETRIDRHEATGEGILGWDTLRAFAIHQKFKSIPIILELPIIPQDKVKLIIETVRKWD